MPSADSLPSGNHESRPARLRSDHADLAGLLCFGITRTGGFASSYGLWLYVLPVAAAVALDLRGVVIWVGITLALMLGFWSLPFFGIDLVSRVPAARQAAQALFDQFVVMLGLAAVGVSFVDGQRRGERELGRANDELERESAYVRLLMHAAVAANQATSLDEALRECAKSVCHAMGWAAGHVYAVNERGVLVSRRIVVGDDAGGLIAEPTAHMAIVRPLAAGRRARVTLGVARVERAGAVGFGFYEYARVID
jgi:hypothetical protein